VLLNDWADEAMPPHERKHLPSLPPLCASTCQGAGKVTAWGRPEVTAHFGCSGPVVFA